MGKVIDAIALFFTFLPKLCLLWLLFGSWNRERQCSTSVILDPL